MGDKSGIEWTDATWNPVAGCSIVSPGCTNCYAMRQAARIANMMPGKTAYDGTTKATKAGAVWTGVVNIGSQLEVPIRWRRPRRIFVNSMSDLFHEALDLQDVAELYGAAIAAVHLRKHTFQILTKRPANMRRMLEDEEFWEIANATAETLVLDHVDPLARRSDDARATCEDYGADKPPPGIWLGVSVEDQARADERIPELLATPAAVRFISAEPLLGPVDLRDVEDGLNCLARRSGTRIDWVIAGGESGPHARPSHPDWFRSLRGQCQAAGVRFFFKQWGEWSPVPGSPRMVRQGDYFISPDGRGHILGADLCSPLEGCATPLRRIGRKAAGALLDGREWREMPA